MNSKRIILVLFILILSIFPSYPFVESAGYGEENENLGQFTDDFENDDNVSVAINVINNQTLDCMELNYSDSVSKKYEDFNTYTEVDGGGDLTVTDNRITWITMRRDAADYVYKDFGVDYFADFEIQYKVVLTDVEAGDATNTLFMAIPVVSNNFGVFGDAVLPDGLAILLSQNGAIDDQFKVYLRQYTGGGLTTNLFGSSRVIGTYYFTVDRIGSAIRFRLYSDEARTVLLETLTDATADNTKYRYINAITSIASGNDPADHSSGYTEYFWKGDVAGGFEEDGYFITEDYLNYTTGNGLVLLTNTSIPSGTSITVQFSNDNSTWVDNEGNVGSTPIGEGFYAIDLRDLNYSDSFEMYNFSTSNSALTPRLYQSRLVTTNGTAGGIINITGPGPTVIQNVTGEWVKYNATAITVITGILDDGFLNSTYFIDADSYEVSEVVGAPGWDIRWNFTNIPVTAICGWMNVFYSYDGNLAHVIEVQLYNWTSSSWDTIGLMIDTGGFVWSNSSMGQYPQNYVNEGLVMARSYHTSPGNINHDIKIEYIKLRVFIPFEDEIIVADADFFWVFIAIVLSIIVGLLMWLKYEHNNN